MLWLTPRSPRRGSRPKGRAGSWSSGGDARQVEPRRCRAHSNRAPGTPACRAGSASPRRHFSHFRPRDRVLITGDGDCAPITGAHGLDLQQDAELGHWGGGAAVAAIDGNPARGRLVRSCDHPHRRGLPGAVRAEETRKPNPSTASLSPYCLVRFATSIIVVPSGALGGAGIFRTKPLQENAQIVMATFPRTCPASR
jgi:hypothetical protein